MASKSCSTWFISHQGFLALFQFTDKTQAYPGLFSQLRAGELHLFAFCLLPKSDRLIVHWGTNGFFLTCTRSGYLVKTLPRIQSRASKDACASELGHFRPDLGCFAPLTFIVHPFQVFKCRGFSPLYTQHLGTW